MLSMRGEKWVWEAKIGWNGNDYEIGPITECNIIDGGSTSGTFLYDERQCKKKKWCFSFKYLIGIKRRNIYQSDWFLGEITVQPLTSLTFITIVRSTPLPFITSERFDVYYEYMFYNFNVNYDCTFYNVNLYYEYIFYNVNVNYECTFYNVYIYNLYYEYNFVLQR